MNNRATLFRWKKRARGSSRGAFIYLTLGFRKQNGVFVAVRSLTWRIARSRRASRAITSEALRSRLCPEKRRSEREKRVIATAMQSIFLSSSPARSYCGEIAKTASRRNIATAFSSALSTTYLYLPGISYEILYRIIVLHSQYHRQYLLSLYSVCICVCVEAKLA